MAKLNGSIEAPVPVSFAHESWSDFVRRSTHRLPSRYPEIASSIIDVDADDGEVRFEGRPEGPVKVSVDLDYTPHDRGDPENDLALARDRLTHGLEEYREYVVKRCDRLDCRRLAA